MVDTIKSFVDKLQAEGVQAGQEQAQRISAEAQQEANRLVSDAEQRAKGIIEAAEAEGERIRAKAKSELALASRDAVNRLRDDLQLVIRHVLTAETGRQLGDADFIKQLLHGVVTEYARSDASGRNSVEVNVSDQMGEQLMQWAAGGLRESLAGTGTAVDIRAGLRGAGFEYRVNEGTIEVTTESVVDVLCELVGPMLRDIVAQALSITGREAVSSRT